MIFTCLAMAVIGAAPSHAQIGDLAEIGGPRNLAAIAKQALRGAPPEGVTVEKLDGGLTKISIPIPENSPVLRQKLAKDLINCAITVELFEPDLLGDILSFDVAPIDLFEYYLGWVTINISDDDITATSSIKTKGPGPDFNSGNTDILYDALAINLVVGVNEDGWEEGLHSIDAKVKGAKPGKLKGNFCAGCT